jgi:hypothetical protein
MSAWCRRTTGFVSRLDRASMRHADNRTISQLEADGYPWIGCECCKGTVWVPFKMLREQLPMLSAMTLDQLGARMRCDKCGKRTERYYPANQSDTPGSVRRKSMPVSRPSTSRSNLGIMPRSVGTTFCTGELG